VRLSCICAGIHAAIKSVYWIQPGKDHVHAAVEGRAVMQSHFALALWAFLSGTTCQPGITGHSPNAWATYGDRSVNIAHIRLAVCVDLPGKLIEATATLRLSALRDIREIALDAVDLDVSEVTLAAGRDLPKVVPYCYDRRRLVILPDVLWCAGQVGVVTITYRAHSPTEGLYFLPSLASDPNCPVFVASCGEPTGSRHWFPCVDTPNQRQTTELIITVKKGLEAISNGRLVERRISPQRDKETFHWRQDKPQPSYLVALAVGDFDVAKDNCEGIPLTYYVPRGRKASIPPTFQRTREMVSYFSTRFGIRYPWDKYAQVAMDNYVGGALENTSVTFLSSSALTSDTSTFYHPSETDLVIAHELAHQWWGDLVTCRDWSHLWLNEGFATYGEALWAERVQGRDGYAYFVLNKSRRGWQDPHSPPLCSADFRRAAEGDVYSRGACVLHMLRKQLGEDAFWRGLAHYGKEYAFRSVETSDFRKALECETGLDLRGFFQQWVERPGCLQYQCSCMYDARNKQVQVHVRQCGTDFPYQFPLQILIRFPDQREVVMNSCIVKEKEVLLVFPVAGKPQCIEVDPDQAVMGVLQEVKDPSLWASQLIEGSTIVSRIRAVDHFRRAPTEGDTTLLARAFTTDKAPCVRIELASLLGKIGGDVCRNTLLRGLYDEDERVRIACIEQCSEFREDQTVRNALRDFLHKPNDSDRAIASAIASYARVGPKDAVAIIGPWLDRPSCNEIIRRYALTALGESSTMAALEPLLKRMTSENPYQLRLFACMGLSRLLMKARPSLADAHKICGAAQTCLHEKQVDLRMYALKVLGELGRWWPAVAMPALAERSTNETDSNLRAYASRLTNKLRDRK
jgi:aminopeptidase N